MNTQAENGRVESYVTVCDCAGTTFAVHKKTKTAISLKCSKCGKASSVKGNVATVRVDGDELAYAVKENLVRPKPGDDAPPKDDKDKGPTLAEQGFRTLRFKITDDQDKTIQRAMEVARVANFGTSDVYRGQQWQGSALEHICADYLSGADPVALDIVSTMDAEVEKAAERVRLKDKDAKLSKRKIRELRASTRDTMLKKMGRGPEEYQPPEADEDEEATRRVYDELDAKKRAELAEDDRVSDDGRLFTGIGEALVEHSDEIAQHAERPQMLIGKPHQFAQLVQRWRKDGGFFFKLVGDERTKDGAGQRPCMFLWVDGIDDLPELSMAYAERFENNMPDASLEIIELVEPGEPQQAAFADGVLAVGPNGMEEQ